MKDLTNLTLLDRYVVRQMLGRGGMADVYLVWDKVRTVLLAMKLLREDMAEDKVFLRRFRREAQNLARLQHPHIVRSYGLERDGIYSFLLMDYVEGTTLRREIFQSGEPLSKERVLEVMRPVCSALNYAHQLGVIHCDAKPANIMIEKTGKVLVSDFGIARMMDAATATMGGAGTPAYMAPEQIKGADPTPQTDIYALGVVLFEMMTGGERPFTGELTSKTGTTGEKIRWEKLNLKAPKPSNWNPSMSDGMEAIVSKCLEGDQVNRYTNALELLDTLEAQVLSPSAKSDDEHNLEELPGHAPVKSQAESEFIEAIVSNDENEDKGSTLEPTKAPIYDSNHAGPQGQFASQIDNLIMELLPIFAWIIVMVGVIVFFFYLVE
jgi:serine/threonine-protein kinase